MKQQKEPRRGIISRCMNMGIVAVSLFALAGCQYEASVPDSFSETSEKPQLFPDYTDVTCPVNIAPLNFSILNTCRQCIAEVCGRHDTLVVGGGADGKIVFEPDAWRDLTARYAGDSLTVRLYVERNGNWQRLAPYKLYVAAEPIDSFLSYRLIEPGYIPYRRLGLYQRNLTDFEVRPIYENNIVSDYQQNHCINCHNYQNYGTSRMLFHVRENHGGTVVADNGHLEKFDFKLDSLTEGAVYPAWHPVKPWVVFSSNFTGQSFHLYHPEKVEVLDMASDLIFFDLKEGVVRHILKTDTVMETFPHWSPDGKRLYFTAARVPEMSGMNKEERDVYTTEHYRDIRYDVMYMDFDEQTGQFSSPVVLINCSAEKKSASVARISPDGRYLLYTLADYGQFHIWHKSADLWVHDLVTDKDYPLEAANSRDVESYHSWSSNGRWIAFSSRRDDGNYTRVYLAYFDRDGRAHKALMLPQADPEQNILLLKSYNVPELTREPVRIPMEDFEQTVYGQQGRKVRFDSKSMLGNR